jgi:RecA-family ATPase
LPDELLESHALLTSTEEEAPDLIPNVLAQEDKIILVAAPKVGKSILAQQLASCVAGGHEFLGIKPSQTGPVLYIAGEGDSFSLRKRGRRMGQVMPVPKDMLYYWPTPTYMLNVPSGLAQLLAFAREVKPILTIIDPIYAVMSGSMKDDDKAGDFLRQMNRYQKDTGSALFIAHHTHRAVKDREGDKIDEDDEAYFGSMLWAAWPKSLWLMRRDLPGRHHIKVSCATNRDGVNALAEVKLTMCEPQPLMFVKRETGSPGAVAVVVLETLKAGHNMTQEEMRDWTGRSAGSVSETLKLLETQGRAVKSSGSPTRWSAVYPAPSADA